MTDSQKVQYLISRYHGKITGIYKEMKIDGEKKFHVSGLLNAFRGVHQGKRIKQIEKLETAVTIAAQYLQDDDKNPKMALGVIIEAAQEIAIEIKKEHPILKSRLADIAEEIIKLASEISPTDAINKSIKKK